MKVKDVLIFFKISSEDITEIKDLSDDSSFNSSSWIYINVSRSENSSKYINEALEKQDITNIAFLPPFPYYILCIKNLWTN